MLASGVSSLKQYQDSEERKVREGRKDEIPRFSLRSLRSSSIEILVQDLRFAFRMLRKAPMLCLECLWLNSSESSQPS